jgi:hypothetical protein
MIQNGHASLDKPMPYLIKNKTGDVVLLIDTTGGVDGFSEKYPKLMLLVTRDKIHFRMADLPKFAGMSAFSMKDQTYTHSFDERDNEVFLGREWIQSSGILNLKYYGAFFIYPMLVGALFGLYFIITLVMASIGRIISVVLIKYSIPFKASLRLGCVVSTAPFALMIALQTLGIVILGMGGFYVALVACYYTYAVIAVKRESQHLVLG